MRRSIFDMARKLYYDYLPDSLRRYYGPAVERLYTRLNRIRMVILDLYLPVSCLTGCHDETAPPLKIITAGRDDTARHLFHAMDPPELETANQTRQGRTWLWNASRVLRAEGSALLVEADRCFSPFLRAKGFITIPHQVNFILDITPAQEEILKRYKKRNWSNYQRFTKQSFTYEPADTPDMMDLFYHRMYLPYIQSRHGKWSLTKPFAYINNLLQYGELIIVKNENMPVGGFLINTSGSIPRLSYIGIMDGREDYLRNGLSPAIYFFAICRAKERGHTQIDFGHCKPFLEDGILKFKRQWGMEAQRSTRVHRAIHLLIGKPHPSLNRFLADNPLICEDRRRLKGLFFMDTAAARSEHEVEKLKKRYTMPGLNQFSVRPLAEASPH